MTIFSWVKGNTATQEIAKYEKAKNDPKYAADRVQIMQNIAALKTRISKGNDI